MSDSYRDELNYWPSFVDIFASLFFVFLILFYVFYFSAYKTAEAAQKDIEDFKLLKNAISATYDSVNCKLVVDSDALFAWKSSILSPEGEISANRLGYALKVFFLQDEVRIKRYTVVVEGHTDTSGYPEVNDKLSLDRANAFIRAMFANDDPFKNNLNLIPAGFGESQPIMFRGEDNKLCRENRRIEIRIILNMKDTMERYNTPYKS